MKDTGIKGLKSTIAKNNNTGYNVGRTTEEFQVVANDLKKSISVQAKKELAIRLHNKKYNCCQSVACAFCEEIGVDEQILFKAGEGFGLGMGCMEGTCGAVSGAVMLAGFKNSDGDLESPGTKAATYRLSAQLMEAFEQRCGSTVCKELKGVDTGTPLCSCQDCICTGVELVQEMLGL